MSIKDVAKKAGVSIGTVSRAFNGYKDISEETRKRIFEIAKKMNYTPNLHAKNLSSKISNNMGMIISGFLHSDNKDNSTALLLKGTYTYTTEEGFQLALYTTDSLEQTKKSYKQFCREYSLAGAILSGITTDDSYFHELLNSEIPCVAIDIPLTGKRQGWVSVDNVKGSYKQTELLLQKGHRNICVISGKKNAAVTLERTAGVDEALEAYGLTLNQNQIYYCDYSEETAYSQTGTLLDSGEAEKYSAFLCFSDLMAFGVIRALQERGRRVPQDFSVVGFDGNILGEYTTPRLSTIGQDLSQIGYESAKLLHKIIKGNPNESDKHKIVPYQILERDSIAEINIP